jgi:hypothetical protein
MRTVSIRFNNYKREYTYLTNLDLSTGKFYEISTPDKSYSTPVEVMRYDVPRPQGIQLKEITQAIALEG